MEFGHFPRGCILKGWDHLAQQPRRALPWVCDPKHTPPTLKGLHRLPSHHQIRVALDKRSNYPGWWFWKNLRCARHPASRQFFCALSRKLARLSPFGFCWQDAIQKTLIRRWWGHLTTNHLGERVFLPPLLGRVVRPCTERRFSMSEKAAHEGHRARVRERFLSGDAASRSDAALLELLLTYALPQRDVQPL